jgi:hypothetical protein
MQKGLLAGALFAYLGLRLLRESNLIEGEEG